MFCIAHQLQSVFLAAALSGCHFSIPCVLFHKLVAMSRSADRGQQLARPRRCSCACVHMQRLLASARRVCPHRFNFRLSHKCSRQDGTRSMMLHC
ncbi:hypothetical protein COO60DRAFT_1514697 [Scenedesmus sp. NREL 46B-D3]|nr:hypothetical protein COO60DRAFT_1514697 [Scenedesmus sp. NREL 46B-D3]